MPLKEHITRSGYKYLPPPECETVLPDADPGLDLASADAGLDLSDDLDPVDVLDPKVDVSSWPSWS